jgi:hypothetical protein
MVEKLSKYTASKLQFMLLFIRSYNIDVKVLFTGKILDYGTNLNL